MKKLLTLTYLLTSCLVSDIALPDENVSTLSLKKYKTRFDHILSRNKEGVLYYSTQNTDNDLSFFISKNSNYYLMTDKKFFRGFSGFHEKSNKLITGLWYEQYGNNIKDPDKIRSGIFRNNRFIGYTKCKSGCIDNYFSSDMNHRQSKNIIWIAENDVMYLSNSVEEELVYDIEFDKKKYKVLTRRSSKPEFDGIVFVYAIQDKKYSGIKLVLDLKKKVINQTYTFIKNENPSPKFPSQLMKSDYTKLTYPVFENNKINDISPEAYDIASALIVNIDENFKTIKDIVFNNKNLQTNQSLFKKYYNMTVTYEKNIEERKLLAIKKKKSEINALYEIKKEVLKDVYFGDKVLIRNGADSPFKGVASQKNIKHFDSCGDIKDGLISYMQIKTDSNGVKTLYQGQLLLEESSLSALTDILLMKAKKEASSFSLPEQALEDKISTEYIKESASHEKIYYINPTHLAFGNSSWTIDAKLTDRKIDHNSKIIKSDALISFHIDKALEDNKNKKSVSKRQADIDLSKKEIGGLIYGSCPTDDFEKLQARLSKKNIDQTLLAKELINSKNRWNRAIKDEEQRQLQQEKIANQCIRYQRTLWNMWGTGQDMYFQFIAGRVYRNEWLPFIRSNCNIKVPHTGRNG